MDREPEKVEMAGAGPHPGSLPPTVQGSGASDGQGYRLTTGPSLATQAYAVLRDLVTSGALPYGERVTERGLAARLGVSSTPVRAAIVRLENEGLLARRATGALQVVTPTLGRLKEMARIQASLRGLAGRLAAENATDVELNGLAEALDAAQRQHLPPRSYEEDVLERLELNRAFHRRIDEASHSPVLVEMVATVTALDWPLRVRSIVATRGRSDAAEHGPSEHQQILDALYARDGDAAEDLCRNHAARGSESYLQVVMDRYPEMGDDYAIAAPLLEHLRREALDAGVRE